MVWSYLFEPGTRAVSVTETNFVVMFIRKILARSNGMKFSQETKPTRRNINLYRSPIVALSTIVTFNTNKSNSHTSEVEIGRYIAKGKLLE